MATPADRYNIEPPAAAAAAAVVTAVEAVEVVEVQDCVTSQLRRQQQSVHLEGEEADGAENHQQVRANRLTVEKDRNNLGGTEKVQLLPKMKVTNWGRTETETNGPLLLEYLALVCVVLAVLVVAVLIVMSATLEATWI